MIDISKIGKKSEPSTSKAKAPSGGPSFSQYLSQIKPTETPNISATSNISIANAIFATQEVNSEEEQKRKQQTIKRGFTLLEKLEEIRLSILTEDFSKEKLIEISRFVKKAQDSTSDEKLNDIIAQIELRIEVELAKRENLFL